MGYTTFSGFKSRLIFNLGNRDLGTGQVESWVNDGYLDLTGAFDFLELHKVSYATLGSDEDSITLPTDLQWLRTVLDSTNQIAIIKISAEQFWATLDQTSLGDPVYWSRDGNILRLQPVPEEDLTLRILYNRFPTVLSAGDDTSELPPTFDRAIVMYSTYHALLDLGEETRAAEWLSRAMAYVRSRLLPQEFEDMGPHLGVRVVTTKDQLRSR